MNKQIMTIPFELKEAEEVSIKNGKYGIIRGLASTYGNIDRGADRVVAGAFDKTIATHIENKRQVRMFFQHDYMSPIGAFPVFKSVENGLWVEGQINLHTQRGEESYALAKQGVLSDFSIGYYTRDSKMVQEVGGHDENGAPLMKDIRELLELELSEISLVTNPMNEDAIVTDIKSLTKISEISKLLKAKGFSNTQANDIIYKIKNNKTRDEKIFKSVDNILLDTKINEILRGIR